MAIIKKIEHEVIKGTYDGKDYDFDRWNIERRNPIATHELSVVINHLDKTVSGDVIRHGGWYDLEKTEVQEMLDLLVEEGKIEKSAYEGYTIKGY